MALVIREPSKRPSALGEDEKERVVRKKSYRPVKSLDLEKLNKSTNVLLTTHFSYRTISGSHIVSEGTLIEVIPP